MHPIAEFLRDHGLKLNTDLGQHFLIDPFALEAIVETAEITDNDHIVEIGPGIGILTKELVSRAKQVTAIELDRRLIPLLEEYTEHPKNLTIVQGNALHVDFPVEPYKIVANIPYHITSPLLRHAFLESATVPKSLTLLIQREVAQKICDKEDASMLTVLVALFGEPHYIATVPPHAFLPPPQVESAILHVECFKKPLTDSKTMGRIFTLTKLGFGQKRKMLRNTLGSLPDGMELLQKAGIDPTRRPQTLSIEEWIALARL